MSIDKQVQFLKDEGFWGDFLIEISEGNYVKDFSSSIVGNIIWSNSYTDIDWLEVGSEMSERGLVLDDHPVDMDMDKLAEQWKKDYPEYFV